VESLLARQNAVANIGSNIFSVDCLMGDLGVSASSPFYYKTLGVAFLPVMVISCVCLFFYVYRIRLLGFEDVDKSDVNLMVIASGLCDDNVVLRIGDKFSKAEQDRLARVPFTDLPKLPANRLAWEQIIHQYTLSTFATSVTVAVFLIHPSVVQQTFHLFSCQTIGYSTTDQYLLLDMTQQCWTGQHLRWVLALGVPMLILYVFALPAGLFFLLRSHKESIVKLEPSIMMRFGFLFRGYKINSYYWEVVVIGRKVVLIGLSCFSAMAFRTQSLLALLVVFVSLGLHLTVKPFEIETPMFNVFETWSITVSFVTFYCGQFLFEFAESAASENKLASMLISYAIVLVNGGFTLTICVYIVYYIWKRVLVHRIDKVREHTTKGITALQLHFASPANHPSVADTGADLALLQQVRAPSANKIFFLV
jgi:hypothetical protein